jgi:hypothetical protein
MSTVHGYLGTMQTLEQRVGLTMGCDITQLPKDIRVGDIATTAMVAVICKALTDNGILTDAQLQAAVDAAAAEPWTNQPL